ncbi:MAG: biotin--[Ruminococcus sp.]|nr:biotin--[acetyl-CoA-carboxylase] ligase [Ruminococcus sp.]
MNVRQKLIALFENNRGQFLSGEELAEGLGCSRAAVWKAVAALKKEGYAIDAVTGRGYRLGAQTDVLSEAGIRKYLTGRGRELTLDVRQSVTSTNTVLRGLAEQGAPEGTAVLSVTQTGGKGRLGRSFFSPADTGLYMSILMRPQMSAADSVRITTAAAIAVSKAVEDCGGGETAIKWVNDVCLRGKKICGILTEASFSAENGGLDYAVTGIGINAYEPEGGFPPEIADVAGAVFQSRREDMRNRLAGAVLSRFWECYHDLFSAGALEYYRSRLMWRGERIRVISGQSEYPAVLLDVDDSYALRVRLDDGTGKSVSSGEITIRRTDK